MTNVGKWSLSGVGLTTVLSGTVGSAPTLNALGSGTMSGVSATYNNQTNLDLYVDIEVFLDTLSPTAGARVDIYMLESVDGTNFPAQSAADLRLTSSALLASIPIGTTASTTQRVTLHKVELPPTALQFRLDNQTGVALASTNNSTVKILPYNYNLNG